MADFFFKNWHHFKQIARFVISGGIAAAVNLTVLYILTDWLGIWYLFSTILAYVVSFLIGFFLQKFWTFENDKKDVLYAQMALYLFLVLFNLVINIVLMYVLVDLLGLWYMLAQFLIIGLIAAWDFMAYKFLVFKIEK